MKIVADLSLYPLKDGPVPEIIRFIRDIREQDGIEIVTNQLSTQLRGEFEAVTGAIGLLALRNAPGTDHVEALLDQGGDQAGGAGGIVGAVAIDQDIGVGLDVGEHAPHHRALALARLAPDDGPRLARHGDRAVGRIVVEDMDGRARQRGAKGRHDGSDRDLLVVTGNQDGDTSRLVAVHGSAVPRLPGGHSRADHDHPEPFHGSG